MIEENLGQRDMVAIRPKEILLDTLGTLLLR